MSSIMFYDVKCENYFKLENIILEKKENIILG